MPHLNGNGSKITSYHQLHTSFALDVYQDFTHKREQDPAFTFHTLSGLWHRAKPQNLHLCIFLCVFFRSHLFSIHSDPLTRSRLPAMIFELIMFTMFAACGTVLLKTLQILRDLQTKVSNIPDQMENNTNDVGLAISAVVLAVEDIQRSLKIICQTLQIDLDNDEPGPNDLSTTMDQLTTTRKRSRPSR